ncbi:MAG: oligopeptidase B [Candidatus Marinimicrobia bacterium]|nr:oligopeptidase B [Candidatus Neomarinimicrobiota bacterium]|tara:strand:+ start:2753 stop:4882 length:2130 start_codon:yes stop_codon:yes gene_type:complete
MKIFFFLGVLIMTSCSEIPVPPIAKKVPYEIITHGHKRIDNYYWMRLSDKQKKSKIPDEQTNAVIKYIKKENNYTEHSLSHTNKFQEKLFDEIVGRIKKDDQTVPYLENGYYYYSRYELGKEYAIYCRKKGSLDSKEEIMLDGNELSKGYDYFAIGSRSVSPNNNWLAYGVDTLSRRFYTIYFKNLITGKVLKHSIPNTSGAVAWANNNKTVFYTSKNKITLLSEKIFRHNIDSNYKDDVLVYQEKDNEYYTGVYRSKSGKFIIIWNNSTLVSDYHILRSDDPYGNFTSFTPRGKEHEYDITHYNNKFYIITNYQAKNNRLMETPDNATDISNWKEVISHNSDIHLLDMEIFNNYLVINERKNGLRGIRMINQKNGEDKTLAFGENTYAAFFSTNKEFNTNIIRYSYSSLVTPWSTYDYNMDSEEKILLKQDEVLGGYDHENYFSERLYATSRDGEKIPISLVYNKNHKRAEPQNLLLYAYGSYGSTNDPYFNAARLSMLDRGFIYAIAHVRGSQIYGRESYEDGKLFNKKNTFNDFIDAGKFLVSKNYTNSEKLFCSGGSAGGLLIGAVINMEPDLWKGAIAEVPFVDVVTTMLDPSIPLTSNEWDEWGDPREKEYYDYMLSYSPYDQVESKNYPNLLVTSGFFDSQVQYFEPLKWVAKLREYWSGNNKLYLHMQMDAGHGGKSGRFRRYKEVALEYAFLLDLAGIKS